MPEGRSKYGSEPMKASDNHRCRCVDRQDTIQSGIKVGENPKVRDGRRDDGANRHDTVVDGRVCLRFYTDFDLPSKSRYGP